MRNISDYFAKYRCVNVAMKLISINKPATVSLSAKSTNR